MRPDPQKCRNIILSEDYIDLIYNYQQTLQDFVAADETSCEQPVNQLYEIIHIPLNISKGYDIQAYGYPAVPSVFSLQDSAAMEAAGITPLLTENAPGSQGKGILIGILDTGIDYSHPAFRAADGTSRILRIWDQSDQSGTPPEQMLFGSEYTQSQIDRALFSPDPFSIVPEQDTNGHGTFLAGIAAGTPSPDGLFTGAAPLADLVIVKLKPAKENLKAYYLLDPEDEVYQETDIMLGLRYLSLIQEQQKQPLVVCLGLGTASGGHDGYTPLEKSLSLLASRPGILPVIAAGNDASRSHHYYHESPEQEQYHDVQLRIPEGEEGFRMELWASIPTLFSIGFITPGGEIYPRIPLRLGKRERVSFLLIDTEIEVDYILNASGTGSQLITFALRKPVSGVWTLRVYPEKGLPGSYHLWLPINGQINDETIFFESTLTTTLSIPGTALDTVVTANYNPRTGAIDIYSGRGYSRLNAITPTLAAPGTNLYGPVPGGGYGRASGTSVSAALTSGAAAVFLAWELRQTNDLSITGNAVRAYLIRGAGKPSGFQYPNSTWGYGTLDLYGVFEALI